MSHPARQEAALAAASELGADALVCADPANVHWLTGVVTDIETGPSPFAPAPACVLTEAGCLVVASEDDPVGDAPATRYEGFTMGVILGVERARALVAEAVGGRVAAGDGLVAQGLAAEGRLLDARHALARARAVKDPLALAALQHAIDVAGIGQARVRELIRERCSELELFAGAREAMDRAAGTRVPVLADLVSGPRTAGMGGAPGPRLVAAGELVLCDLAPRVAGTWGDSCTTLAVGEPSAEYQAAHAAVAAALRRAMDAVRPGASAGAVDALARAGLEYAHHTGHGLGSAYHELPRLIPGADDVLLEEDMVIALEPATYAAQFGVRLEHVVRVTADGCVDLSSHALEL